MKPAVMAWRTRRMNDKLGLVRNRITTQKINQFIETNNPNERVRSIALNLHLDNEVLAKRTNTSIRSVKSFVPWIAEWILKNESRIGKRITTPALKRYRQGMIEKNSAFSTTKAGKYQSDGKTEIHNRVTELLLDDASPKQGVVATLAYMFNLEKKLVTNPRLKDLQFHSYEYPYLKKGKIIKYNKVHRKQLRLLMRNKLLGEKCMAFFANINDVLRHETEDRFAHLFLDYCGSISTNGKTLEMVLQRKLVKKGGIVWVTFCSRSLSGDSAQRGLPSIAQQHSENYRVEPILGHKLFRYKSRMDKRKKRGNTMFTMLLRRIK